MNMFERLTIGEVAKVEEIAGMGLASFEDEDAPKGKLLAGLVFVFKKRENPDYTIGDAYAMEINEANDYLSSLAGDDPKSEG